MRNFLMMLGTTLFLTTACQAQHMEPTKDTTPTPQHNTYSNKEAPPCIQ